MEAQLEKLSKILEALESDELPLDQSLQKFEEGIRLTKSCQAMLEASEKKISQLLSTERAE
ncbi:exodeoxyribonuclease VII small subunit [Ignatzschineria cameli]|uniref:Exodeoxyribonuclease 7 small subunit n=1 Tax=Ignatzschineria cameli TaxID=2182793 RepID=A0A2U2AL69_9GAMM|nr:exodeoxyribonuclease VII small subunit [Ignatzschineria cameli]PWD85469.1 exodeoxyribonuclease VII small subunit [Ignatzschineria cameli]PWD88883.1 exodeoxyribonuclease VII small subunit [Ignatzschineria cameli]PWD90276.1 exodeoxyribonuclease VII small subunit [Ignatzschineria cameli]PWD90743.1 exodeoxyribonuclease VII small subunit [Ignatzschineria cameli]